MTGLRERRVHAAKDGFHAAFVFRVDFVEQLLQRRHVRVGIGIGDELRRKPAAEADMHALRRLAAAARDTRSNPA